MITTLVLALALGAPKAPMPKPTDLATGASCVLKKPLPAFERVQGKGKKVKLANGESLEVLTLQKPWVQVRASSAELWIKLPALKASCGPLRRPSPPAPEPPAAASNDPASSVDEKDSLPAAESPVPVLASAPAATPGAAPSAQAEHEATQDALGAPPETPQAPSSAGKTKIAVMDIRTLGAVAKELATSLTALIPQELDAMGPFKSISKQDIEQMLAFEKMKDNVGCDEVSCLAEIGGALGADYIVSGSLNLIGDTHLLQLQLLNIHQAKVDGRVSREHKGSITGLLDETRTAAKVLVRELLVSKSGRVHVQVSEEGATIRLDGVIVGTSPMPSFEVGGGLHTLSAEKEGFIRTSKDVQILAKADAPVALQLLPSADYIRAYRSRTAGVRLVAWSALGAGILGAGGAALLYVAGQQKAADYRKRVATYNAASVRSTDEFSALERLDQERGTLDLFTLVSAGVGLLGLGTSATVFALGDDPNKYDGVASGDGVSVVPHGDGYLARVELRF